ncbi:MAG TPA: hemolysin III family protein [Dehalococcoidia bacterium]|nr:hemolysin III family protein [Dehalococcoidia bacterium]
MEATGHSPSGRARSTPGEERVPQLRGVLHLVAAGLAPVGLLVLLLIADSPARYVGAAVFASSLILLYATSATYHVGHWPQRARDMVMRADHATIFVFIAGTYTPFCLVTLGGAWGISMLSVVWTFAGLGALLKIIWPRAPRWLGVSLYLGLGWIGAIAAAPIISSLPVTALALLVTGGMLYTVGAIVYATRWPDPFPRMFGFHEVFHALVVAGTVLHFTLIALYVVS